MMAFCISSIRLASATSPLLVITLVVLVACVSAMSVDLQTIHPQAPTDRPKSIHSDRLLAVDDFLHRRNLTVAHNETQSTIEGTHQHSSHSEPKPGKSQSAPQHLSRFEPQFANPVSDNRPSYQPVFFVFSFAALICLAVTLHIVYLEWKKKQAFARADLTDLAMSRDTMNGGQSAGTSDMIPMTLKREFQILSNLSRFDSYDRHSSQPSTSRAKPQGLLAFESVSK